MSDLVIETPRVFMPLLANHMPDGTPVRYKGAHGGRGSGKSHNFGDLWLEENVSDKFDVVCVRETLKSLEFSVKKLLESKIEAFNAGDYFDVQDRRILSRNGGTTIFEGMQNHTAESIKSLEGFDRAWFTEAQNATEKSLTILRPTIRKPGSQIWADWNPSKATDPIDALLRGAEPPPGSIVVEANFMDNPWLPDVLRTEMEYDKRRDPDKYAHVWLGKYQQRTEARVFKNWVIEEFERPAGTIHRLGADWGFATDPSVLVRCDIDGNRLYVDYEAYQVGCEIVNLPELFMGVPDAENWPITADSARPETISHMRNHGFPKIRAAIKGARSLEEGVEFLQSFDIVVHPRCIHVIDELTLYKYKEDPLTGLVLPILEDKHNHVIDALRYACEGARRAMKVSKPKAKPVVRRVVSTAHGWMGK
ncbi:PBSX family phage terminase large subunit [Burkholderia gladioli]|uniref:PBSX family phage terminase large subunit n=1 Tax=Burkholderia gladioli TaxID=28095 RepID=UPI001640CE86|nr:PBSX family phage terminase large subunit [Burkholderia gladioli]